MSNRLTLTILSVLFLVRPAAAQPELPAADGVDWAHFRTHCGQLLAALQTLKAPLPAETEQALRTLLREEQPTDPREAAARVQKLLDPHCLIGVTINPESRVKAARGPRLAEVTRDQETVVLVKVVNEGGVRHALAVSGPQLRAEGQPTEGRWLEATVLEAPPLHKALSGERLEYFPLRLTSRESGKREATLSFDVGQGTQDLGFRAEVPVLFRVKE